MCENKMLNSNIYFDLYYMKMTKKVNLEYIADELIPIFEEESKFRRKTLTKLDLIPIASRYMDTLEKELEYHNMPEAEDIGELKGAVNTDFIDNYVEYTNRRDEINDRIENRDLGFYILGGGLVGAALTFLVRIPQLTIPVGAATGFTVKQYVDDFDRSKLTRYQKQLINKVANLDRELEVSQNSKNEQTQI